jgi:hypothetical protein
MQGPICKISSELKVKDDYGVCSLGHHRKFTGISYNLSYRPLILDPSSLGARVQQGEMIGDVRLTSSSPEKSQHR